MDHVAEQWQSLAIAIGDSVFKVVNSSATVGTDDETGYILMFFNKVRHNGRSTIVSSATDKADIKKLLKEELRTIDRAAIVESGRSDN